MHTHHGNAVVDDIHAVTRHDVGDRSAAAKVDAAELRELVADIVRIHHTAQLSAVLRARIARAGFSARACKLIEHHASPEIGDVLLLKRVRIEAVIGT